MRTTNEIVSQWRQRKDKEPKEPKEREEHRLLLEQRFGIVGHPKASKLYEIAWSMGHSSGFSEVENYYMDMVDLLKP